MKDREEYRRNENRAKSLISSGQCDPATSMGGHAVEPLARLKWIHAEEEDLAMRALSGITDPYAVEDLAVVLYGTDGMFSDKCRLAAAEALSNIKDARALEAILKANDKVYAEAAMDAISGEPSLCTHLCAPALPKDPFGDFAEIVFALALGYVYTAETTGREWGDVTRYSYSYDNAIMALRKLCGIPGQLVNNLLYMVMARGNATVAEESGDMKLTTYADDAAIYRHERAWMMEHKGRTFPGKPEVNSYA